MTKRAVLFDFDGTLTKTDTVKFMFLNMLIYRPYLLIDVFKFYTRRKIDKYALQLEKCRITALMIKGFQVDKLKEKMSLFRKLSSGKFRNSMIQSLRGYIENGYEVIIATASPSFAVKELFNQSIVVLGTEYEIKNGRYTGNLSGEPCYGEHKAKIVSGYLTTQNIDEIEAAFSDDSSDLKFLALAKHGFLVAGNGETNSVP